MGNILNKNKKVLKKGVQETVPEGYEVAIKKNKDKFLNNGARQTLFAFGIYILTLLASLGAWQFEKKTGINLNMNTYVFVICIYIGMTFAVVLRDMPQPNNYVFISVLTTFIGMLLGYSFMKFFRTGDFGIDSVPALMLHYFGVVVSFVIFAWLWSQGEKGGNKYIRKACSTMVLPILVFVIAVSPFVWLLLFTKGPGWYLY